MRTTILLAVALGLLSACGSADPHKIFSDASSTAASAQMLVDARVKGHVTHSFAERLLETERQEAHSLGSQLPYDRVSERQRPAALATMSRLALILDQLASDETSQDDSALVHDARNLSALKIALDSLSAAPGQR
jgi:hypothetical protein